MKFFYDQFGLLFVRNLQDLCLYFLHIYEDQHELKDFSQNRKISVNVLGPTCEAQLKYKSTETFLEGFTQ